MENVFSKLEGKDPEDYEDLHDHLDDEDDIYNESAIIQEATLSTKERNKLDDSDFGIPELRKYPLTDKKHVRSAVSYFHKAPAKYKPQLAKRILKAAHKYGMDTENWDTINEYAKKKSHVQESFIPLKREGMDWDHTSDSYTFDNPNIHMRPATEDDIENMYQWEMESIDKSLQNDEKVQSLIRQDCHDSLKDTQIITDHDEPIGMLTTCMIDNGEWRYIGEIYLIPEYRGQGIGSNILKQEIAKYNKIRLQVSMDNKGALNLYTSLGFKIVKENPEGRMYIMEYEKPEAVQEAAYTNSGINRANVRPVKIVYRRFSTKNDEQYGPIKKFWEISDKYFPKPHMTCGFGWDWTDDPDFAYGIIINEKEIPEEFMPELKAAFPDVELDENFLIPKQYEKSFNCALAKCQETYDKIWDKGPLVCELEEYPSEGQMKISVIYKKDKAELDEEVAKHIKSVQEFVDPIAKMKDDVTGSMNFMNYLMKVDLLTKGSVSESLKQLKHSAPNGLHPIMFMGFMDPEDVNMCELKDLEKNVIYADDEGNLYSCFFNSYARKTEISQIASSMETFLNDLPKRKVSQPNTPKHLGRPVIELKKDDRTIHSHHELKQSSISYGSEGCYMNTYYSYFAILEAFEFKRNQIYNDICNVILEQFDGEEDKFEFDEINVDQENWATAKILFRFKYEGDTFVVVIPVVSMRTQPAKLYHDNTTKDDYGMAGGARLDNDFSEIQEKHEEPVEETMAIGSNDYGVCYQEYTDNGKIKVNNVPYNMMYFGSYKDFGNNMLKLDNPRLFVTPFKGIASIFTIDRSRYMIPRGKSCNLAYDEWNKDTSQLDKPFDDVHVKVEGIPEMEHRSFENEGWIYGIDISNLKDHIYQEPWMDSEREFLILDVHEIPIAMKLNHKTVVYVEGADKNEVKDAPTNENVFYSNHREPINEKTVKKFMKKGKADLTTGLQHLPLTDKLTGYLWDTKDGNVVAYVAVEEKKDGNWISGLELSDKYQNKGYGKQLLDFAENELNADHLSVNKSNKSAIDLYSNNGWETYKDDVDTVYMKKNLSGEQIQEAFFGIGFGNLRKVIADKLGSACTVTNVQNPTGKEEKFVVKLNEDPEDFVNVISTGTGVKAYGYKHGERFSIFNNASLSAAAPRLIEAICDAFNIQKPVTEAFEFFEETVTVDGHRLIELAYYKKITNLTPEQEQILQDYANARDQLQAAAAYYTRETKARKKALKRMQLEHNTSKSEYQRDQLNRKMARTRIELDVLARDYAEAYQRNVQTMNQLADKFDEIELSKKNNPTPSPMNDTRDSITIPIPKILRKPRELLGSFLNFEEEKDDNTEV